MSTPFPAPCCEDVSLSWSVWGHVCRIFVVDFSLLAVAPGRHAEVLLRVAQSRKAEVGLVEKTRVLGAPSRAAVLSAAGSVLTSQRCLADAVAFTETEKRGHEVIVDGPVVTRGAQTPSPVFKGPVLAVLTVMSHTTWRRHQTLLGEK